MSSNVFLLLALTPITLYNIHRYVRCKPYYLCRRSVVLLWRESASVHDGRLAEDLIPPDVKGVWGDKGYPSKRLERWLSERGIYNGIMEKGHRDRELTVSQKMLNRIKAIFRGPVEVVFAHMKGWYGKGRVRYKGLVKNRADFKVFFSAYNIRVVIGNIARQYGLRVLSY